jgi:beta-glucuronidase
MTTSRLWFLLLIAGAHTAHAVTMNHAIDRPSLSLDGKWRIIVDPYDNGYLDYRYQPFDAVPSPKGGFFLDRRNVAKDQLVEYNFDTSSQLSVPRDWNSQESTLLYYEGAVWYRRLFQAEKVSGKRTFLHFSAANYAADVYLNGQKLGRHVGGFTPFDFEVTNLLRSPENSLVVRVDNRRQREGVPTLNTDWWNYGGITRDVTLVSVPETFIADAVVQLDRADPRQLTGFVQLNGAQAQQQVSVTVPELNVAITVDTDEKGRGVFVLPVDPGLQRWSPDSPRLYQVVFTAKADRLDDRVGFRTIEVKGGEILLNGAPIFLRGTCVHEENPLKGGRASTIEDARLLLTWAKELNCNFLRLAHYPHSENMARLADQMGLLLWEEIPVYWTIQWENPATLANARQQLSEVIQRDRNRASVIIWSVANETPVSTERTQFLRTLVSDARTLDGTRLVSAAMEVRASPDDQDIRVVDDPFGEFTDIISFNEYIGWYSGTHERIGRIVWQIKFDKPVVISEFGAEALQGFHADELTRFSEEYQARLYQETLAMLRNKIPQFRGVTPWILCDFRSPRRNLPQFQDNWNRKGLIGENGIKKSAFWVLKAFYDEMARTGR